MSRQTTIGDEDLRRIIELAESYADEQKDLSEDQVREIGEALGIKADAMDKAIAQHRSQSTNEHGTWLREGQGIYLARGSRPGVSRPLLARLVLLVGVGVAVGVGMLSTASSIPLGAWVIGILLVGAFVGYPAAKLLGQAQTRSFVVGLANRVVVGKISPSGQVTAWERPLAGVELDVSVMSNGEGGWEFLPMYELVFRDRENGRICAFSGMPKHELERIRDRFVSWRRAQSETLQQEPEPR